ncbi:hypothetical protein [Streptomyces sp. ISL-11]|uniref:hypothetical protein n=1 Tax=Streptomyces sp. ISL-11 TaxID=2819174 RepID=UPI001BE4E70E|nr:hypothetical protein [Streptomyces sp. ISL-11]MBT2383120.1 hypothetical protein [Streptomyces sp. ISL-11]
MVRAADPFEGHNPYALLAIILFGLVIAATLAVYGFATMARHGMRRSGMPVTLRYLASLAGAAAVAVYTWGAVHLMLLDETGRDQACKEAVGTAHAMHIDGYRPTYIPLRLGCHVTGDGTYAAGVPEYIIPTVLVLAFIALVLAIFAAFESERRISHVIRKEADS